jgi:protoheme IX farnesyltransferase
LNSESIKTIPSKAFQTDRKAGNKIAPYIQLTKPRLSMMSVASVIFGYYSATPERNAPELLSLLAGTMLAASGCAALNQWMEAKEDRMMARTSDRPIPSGEVKPSHALWIGSIISILGLGILYWGTNTWATALTAGVLFSYLALYTPMKKATPLSTEVGAISGALPPLLGYVAATGAVSGTESLYGWLLFGILFTWQMPHFMAISYIHSKDYKEAGFRMLVHEANGTERSARKSLFYTVLLIALTYLPLSIAGNGPGGNEVSTWYLVLNTLLSLYILAYALRFLSQENREANAKALFYSTIVYLPVFMISFALDRYL